MKLLVSACLLGVGCRYDGKSNQLLKERSASCGSGQIYDGTFTHTLTEGDGLTAQMLKKKGVEVYGESQLEELINDRPFFFSI